MPRLAALALVRVALLAGCASRSQHDEASCASLTHAFTVTAAPTDGLSALRIRATLTNNGTGRVSVVMPIPTITAHLTVAHASTGANPVELSALDRAAPADRDVIPIDPGESTTRALSWGGNWTLDEGATYHLTHAYSTNLRESTITRDYCRVDLVARGSFVA